VSFSSLSFFHRLQPELEGDHRVRDIDKKLLVVRCDDHSSTGNADSGSGAMGVVVKSS